MIIVKNSKLPDVTPLFNVVEIHFVCILTSVYWNWPCNFYLVIFSVDPFKFTTRSVMHIESQIFVNLFYECTISV